MKIPWCSYMSARFMLLGFSIHEMWNLIAFIKAKYCFSMSTFWVEEKEKEISRPDFLQSIKWGLKKPQKQLRGQLAVYV